MNHYTAYAIYNSYGNDLKLEYLEACRLWVLRDAAIFDPDEKSLQGVEDELENHFTDIVMNFSLSREHSFNLTQALVSCLEVHLFPEFNGQYEDYIIEWEN